MVKGHLLCYSSGRSENDYTFSRMSLKCMITSYLYFFSQLVYQNPREKKIRKKLSLPNNYVNFIKALFYKRFYKIDVTRVLKVDRVQKRLSMAGFLRHHVFLSSARPGVTILIKSDGLCVMMDFRNRGIYNTSRHIALLFIYNLHFP